MMSRTVSASSIPLKHISKAFLWLVLMLPMLLAGCVKNEFNVEFKLDPKVNGNYRLVYYASDKRTGFMMDMVAMVDKGVCRTRCITRNPVIVYIYDVGHRLPAAAFYAERGDKIKIEGKDADPLNWNIDGNKINREWSKWRIANADVLRSGNYKDINAAVAKYVKANDDSKVSALLLLTLYDRRQDEAGFSKLWNMLSDGAKPESLVELVGRSDRLTPAAIAAPEAVATLQLHTMGDSLVELNPKRYKATLLCFNRSDDLGAYGSADSLRNLLKEKESERGRIAVISFETDSIAWLTKARRDSLDKVLNAWMPLAEAAEEARALGITRTPYFVVANKAGKQVYRGESVIDAVAAYRKLLKTPDAPAKKAKAAKKEPAKEAKPAAGGAAPAKAVKPTAKR